MKQVFFFVVMMSLCMLAMAQEMTNEYAFFVNENEMETHSIVIAPSGLKLRATPEKDGKVLQTIPFGVKVRLEENFDNVPEDRSFTIDENYSSYWMLVSYGNKKGYCCAAYLGKRILKMTKNYYFSSPYGIGCFESDVLINPTYYTYGVFESEEKQEIREIKIEYFNNRGEMSIRLLTVQKEEERNFSYIIYSKQQMKTGVLKGKRFIPKDGENISMNQLFAVNYSETNKNIYNNIEIEKGKYTISSKSVTKKDKDTGDEIQLQRISITEKATGKKYILGEYYSEHITLEWAGDIDGDGKIDIILNFGSDHASSTIFFFSRNAPNGKLLIEEGEIEYYDCC